jgi:hypothetical protein
VRHEGVEKTVRLRQTKSMTGLTSRRGELCLPDRIACDRLRDERRALIEAAPVELVERDGRIFRVAAATVTTR